MSDERYRIILVRECRDWRKLRDWRIRDWIVTVVCLAAFGWVGILVVRLACGEWVR